MEEITKKTEKNIIGYKDIQGRDVELSVELLRRILPSLAKVKDDEVYNFALRCRAMGLNPLLDVHNVVFGDNEYVTPIVKKDYYLKNAQNNPKYKGFRAGIVVATAKGEIIEREGTIVAPSEQLLGGWARVYTDDNEYYNSVNLDEYVMRTKEGRPNRFWFEKPATMCRKVALNQTLREALQSYSGTYSAEEILQDEITDVDFEDVSAQKELPKTEPKTSTRVIVEATEENKPQNVKKNVVEDTTPINPADVFN